MFVSTAVKLTPEIYARLKPFLDDLGLTPEHAQVVEEMLALRHLPNGPSIPEIARSGDLSAQTVGRLDRAAHLRAYASRLREPSVPYPSSEDVAEKYDTGDVLLA